MKIPKYIRKEKEHMFPDLYWKWIHWNIMGDGYYIDVVEVTDLIKALNTVENNFGKFSSIKVGRATVDSNGYLLEAEKSLFEISRFV